MSKEWEEKIAQDIKNHQIMAYIRGTPEAPRCGFTARVLRVLKELGQPFGTDDMDRDPELWATLKEINDWPTSPQIYVKGEFVGGCDTFCELYRTGDLHKMLGLEK